MHAKVKGFTLIELIVALAVAGVLAGVAFPSFQALAARSSVRAATGSLSTTFAAARLRAISRRLPVSVCPSDDGRSCLEGVGWETGWISFDDPDRSGHPAAGAPILQRGDAVSAGLRVRGTQGRRLVRFLPNGSAAGTNLTLTVCGRGIARAVVVSNAGRARIDASPPRAACS